MKLSTGAITKTTAKLMFCFLAACMLLYTGMMQAERIHGEVWIEAFSFTESSRQLNNPYRGFYIMYGFIPGHDNPDLQKDTMKRLQNDPRMLAMVQINLARYTQEPISQEGLEDIETIFRELKALGKQYIIRFLYDWEGKSITTEPQDVEIILNHMRQLEDVFREYSDIIFIQQGAFIGNWGELNGTKHLGELQRLVLQLAAVTGDNTYLAVRMPAQWRTVTGFERMTEEVRWKSSLARRLSLFNDGMMGNISDYGTYGTKSKEEAGIYSLWNREEELAFQEDLGKYVPNGGEVIVENPLNDFENAVYNLETMHITYLNLDYDKEVLNKWEASRVTEDGCFNGMDGLTYVERRLGYRLLIDQVELEYTMWTDNLVAEITLKNVGFAPLYKEPEKYLLLRHTGTNEVRKFPLEAELRSLTGGNDTNQILTVTRELPLSNLEAGEYEVFFCLRDTDSGLYIELANEQDMQKMGYLIGRFILAE